MRRTKNSQFGEQLTLNIHLRWEIGKCQMKCHGNISIMPQSGKCIFGSVLVDTKHRENARKTNGTGVGMGARTSWFERTISEFSWQKNTLAASWHGDVDASCSPCTPNITCAGAIRWTNHKRWQLTKKQSKHDFLVKISNRIRLYSWVREGNHTKTLRIEVMDTCGGSLPLSICEKCNIKHEISWKKTHKSALERIEYFPSSMLSYAMRKLFHEMCTSICAYIMSP